MSTDTKPENQLPAENKRERAVAMVSDDGPFALLLDTNRFEHLWRIATAFSKSELVPTAFQNKPENCFVALQAALRLEVDPFMFLQSCYVVHGKPGIEAKLAIALLHKSGRIRGTIFYDMAGEGMKRQCTARAVDAATGEIIEQTITMDDAKKEGWIDKTGSKWKTIPDLMLKYRSAAWLIRLHYPDVIMGMQTKEEVEDTCTVDAVPDRPALPKRAREVDLPNPENTKPNGTKGHQTNVNLRDFDLPQEVIDAYQAAIEAGDAARCEQITVEGIQNSGSESVADTFQSAGDCARAQIERNKKTQKELVS